MTAFEYYAFPWIDGLVYRFQVDGDSPFGEWLTEIAARSKDKNRWVVSGSQPALLLVQGARRLDVLPTWAIGVQS